MFFSTKAITVEFGCSQADRPKMPADRSADILGQSALLQPNSTMIVLVLGTLFRLLSLYNLVVLLSASPLY